VLERLEKEGGWGRVCLSIVVLLLVRVSEEGDVGRFV